MTLEIREAARGDIPGLCYLINEMGGYHISPEGMEGRFQLVENSTDTALYVCGGEEGMLGFFSFRIRENVQEVSRYGEVSVIAVAPQRRGQGVGRFMMEYAEKLSAKNGCKETWLVSGLWRGGSHEFYRKLGYEITGYRFVKPVEE